ncbi:MAG: hypothetical protein CVU89_08330 [Firmicutes bacterium HGW-Firmicutes-14]|nr:MAG: hypothetical protein CVU89_08330 [Firmicutes bacterium HGW-Firmicutes-14]
MFPNINFGQRKIIQVIIVLTLTFSVLTAGCESPEKLPVSQVRKETLTVGGTGANMPLLKKLAGEFSEKHPEIFLEIPACLDSDSTVENVTAGNLDIGFTGQSPDGDILNTDLEVDKYAHTLLVFGVNPSVQVSTLTGEQVKAIYSGRITNWKTVGGADREIVVLYAQGANYIRDIMDSSLKGFSAINITGSAVMVDHSQAMNEGITSIQNSIGYTDLGSIKADNLKIKTLTIDNMVPTVENYKKGGYPFVQDLYIITKDRPGDIAGEFVEFVLGWEGKKIILENGYMVPD